MTTDTSAAHVAVHGLPDPAPEPADDVPAFADARLSVTSTTRGGPVRVHVWPARDASHRPVLFCCHGWTDSGLGFGPLAAALGGRWTVIAVDAPGHGGTPWRPAPRYRVAEHLDGALAVLDQLPEVAGRRADVVLLGHDLGALTAARLAAERPGVVRHLVLEDPARAVLRRVPSAAAMRRWVTALQALDDAALLDAARAELPGAPDDELVAWTDGVRTVSTAALAVPVDWGEPMVALLAEVTAPVTLVHGTLSRGGTVSGVAARRCAAACRGGAETVELGTGHHPRRQAREPFVAVLAAALGRYER